MTTLKLSPNSLGHYMVCRRFYWYYKVLNRRLVRSSPGRIAGTAMHAGLLAFNRGKPTLTQDAEIDAVYAKTPTPIDDYRQANFTKDGLAAFRAEFSDALKGWTIEEAEATGEVELGQISYRSAAGETLTAQVILEFRRDLVAVDPGGLRFVWDYKTASRNEQVEWEAAKNSGALMDYALTYQLQHGKSVHGAYLVRLITRKPTKSGVQFEFPKDGPIFFGADRLEERRRQTLLVAREILERDRNDPDAWPLSSTDKGACRFQWGTCDYLGVCSLPVSDRMLKLSTDEFEDAEAAKQRERDAGKVRDAANGE